MKTKRLRNAGPKTLGGACKGSKKYEGVKNLTTLNDERANLESMLWRVFMLSQAFHLVEGSYDFFVVR